MSPLEASPLPSRGAPRTGTSPESRNLVNGRVHISEYDAKWPYLFKRESEKVRAALGDRVLLFEHVGSTAVPGMAAKPCVDLLLVVADPADEPAYLADLEAAAESYEYGYHSQQPTRVLTDLVSDFAGLYTLLTVPQPAPVRARLCRTAGQMARMAAIVLRPWGKLRSGRVGLAVRLVGDSAGRRANGHEFGAREATGRASGRAVGDQASDGEVGLLIVLAASGVALKRMPLLVLGVGVFDHDAGR